MHGEVFIGSNAGEKVERLQEIFYAFRAASVVKEV